MRVPVAIDRLEVGCASSAVMAQGSVAGAIRAATRGPAALDRCRPPAVPAGRDTEVETCRDGVTTTLDWQAQNLAARRMLRGVLDVDVREAARSGLQALRYRHCRLGSRPNAMGWVRDALAAMACCCVICAGY